MRVRYSPSGVSKPDNRDYFRDPRNIQRVQDCLAEHNGYWMRQLRKPHGTLQEIVQEN
ncbi:MAG TPA: hypothetical protein VN765_04215 [Candidatus Acidoferrum sp.]|nr:hypothetical protein [Candidatus Acidoferrum sp.]